MHLTLTGATRVCLVSQRVRRRRHQQRRPGTNSFRHGGSSQSFKCGSKWNNNHCFHYGNFSALLFVYSWTRISSHTHTHMRACTFLIPAWSLAATALPPHLMISPQLPLPKPSVTITEIEPARLGCDACDSRHLWGWDRPRDVTIPTVALLLLRSS